MGGHYGLVHSTSDDTWAVCDIYVLANGELNWSEISLDMYDSPEALLAEIRELAKAGDEMPRYETYEAEWEEWRIRRIDEEA